MGKEWEKLWQQLVRAKTPYQELREQFGKAKAVIEKICKDLDHTVFAERTTPRETVIDKGVYAIKQTENPDEILCSLLGFDICVSASYSILSMPAYGMLTYRFLHPEQPDVGRAFEDLFSVYFNGLGMVFNDRHLKDGQEHVFLSSEDWHIENLFKALWQTHALLFHD